MQHQPPRTLRLGLVLPSQADHGHGAALGARFGLEEAIHAARLFGGSVELEQGSDPASLISHGAQVLIGGLPGTDCGALSDLARARGVLFLNIGCEDDALRGARCSRNSYHIAMSAAMRRDALDAAKVEPGDQVLLWHESLERFGAGQLNPRFRDRLGVAMDSDAWAAWMAVKIAAETFFRAGSGNASDLMDHLARSSARFDGHKGRALSFRAWDHQLRQPLYVVRAAPARPGDAIVEVPGRGTGATTVAEQLDQLGTAAGTTACSWQD